MIRYREGRASDVTMVIKNWRDSIRTTKYAGLICMSRWASVMEVELRHILARPGVELYVACNPDESPDSKIDAHGWIAIERGFRVRKKQNDYKTARWEKKWLTSKAPLVHFVYVKPLYQRRGIARGLFRKAKVDPSAAFYYTSRTAVYWELKDKVPLARFDPLIARHPKNDNRSQENEGDPNRTHPIREPDTERAGV